MNVVSLFGATTLAALATHWLVTNYPSECGVAGAATFIIGFAIRFLRAP